LDASGSPPTQTVLQEVSEEAATLEALPALKPSELTLALALFPRKAHEAPGVIKISIQLSSGPH